jgi:hypothetical protein
MTVTVMRRPGGSGWAVAAGAATSLVSWQAAGIVLALGVMSGVLDLLKEWQWRRTLAMLVAHAPIGTVVTERTDQDGRSMRVAVGDVRSGRDSSDHSGRRV